MPAWLLESALEVGVAGGGELTPPSDKVTGLPSLSSPVQAWR